MKLRIKEAIVVEGRCDKAKLCSLIEGIVVETSGFGIFKDQEKMELIRLLAKKRGVIILTDSDGAGFVIRRRLSQSLPKSQVKHAYIPDIYGKERRKRQPSKEGKLGVEGMSLTVLEDCLRRAGADVLCEEGPTPPSHPLTKADLYDLGLSGGPHSAEKRSQVLLALKFPLRLSANGLLQALQALYTRDEALSLLENILKD